jgi:2-polyprenyl-3-methyl-5-hydroxy-6-metoxy-1,4-benzoquinol methylase
VDWSGWFGVAFGSGDCMQCKICKNEKLNIPFLTKSGYDYFECSFCKTLQIKEIPQDNSSCYENSYYSYNLDYKKLFGKLYFASNIIIKSSFLIYPLALLFTTSSKIFLKRRYEKSYWLYYMLKKFRNLDAKILDVGSGNGALLNEMHKYGFKNLTGIEPFLPNDMDYGNGVKIYKKELNKMQEKFDLIMFHHSLEHIPNPLETFESIHRLLNKGGITLIRIPVAGSYAWRKYNTLWAQLDAPRHLFIFSVYAIKMLAEKNNLRLEEIFFDSTIFQITASEQRKFSENELSEIRKFVYKLNENFDGDQAMFIFRKEIYIKTPPPPKIMMFYDSFFNRKKNRLGSLLVERLFEKLAKIAGKYFPIKILEIGIGNGIFYEKLKKEIPQMEYTGIEANNTMFEEAKKKGIDVIRSFIPPFPQNLEKGSFDLIIMSHVLEHFRDYREILEVLNGINALLKPSGKLLLFYPCARDYGIDFFDCDYSHSYITTQSRVKDLLFDSGFRIIRQDFYRACFNSFRLFFYILSRAMNFCSFLNIRTRNTFQKNLLTIAEKV